MTKSDDTKIDKAAAQKNRIARERAARLESALRANLLKRKAQSRARVAPAPKSDPPVDC